MGKTRSNSWLNVVKKAFRSPAKDKNEERNSKRREEQEQEEEEKVRHLPQFNYKTVVLSHIG